MSESNETFDEKFGEFFNQLCSMNEAGKLVTSDLEHVTDAFFVAPEKIADYLAACSQLTELRATIEARADHGKQQFMEAAGQRAVDRTKLVHAYRDLVTLWHGILATCEDVEQIPRLVRKFLARRV